MLRYLASTAFTVNHFKLCVCVHPVFPYANQANTYILLYFSPFLCKK